MHPSAPQETVPLHEGGYSGHPGGPAAGGYPGHPGGLAVVQHTVVNVPTQTPRDHIIWSIFSLFYMNPFCLGLAALIYSVKARDRKMVGDLNGARLHGTTARNLNIAATALTCFSLFLFVIFIVNEVNQSYYHYPRY